MVNKLLKIIVVLLSLIFCGICYLFFFTTVNRSFDMELELHSRGTVYRLEKDENYETKEDGSLMISYGDITVDPKSSPLYSLDNNSIILTNKFVFVKPTLSEVLVRLKLYPLTSIRNENGYVVLSKKSKEISEIGGFLYDGGDMYITLEPSTLSYGGKTISLGPLSFVRVKAGEDVEYFDTATNKYVTTTFEKLISLYTEDYEINLSMDTVKYGSKETYVPSTVDVLNDYFEGDK